MKFRAAPTVVSAVVLAFSSPLGAAVAPAFAQDAPSYSMEDVTACSADAMRLCRDKMPDLEKIEDCMKANYDNLRPKCKARFDRQH